MITVTFQPVASELQDSVEPDLKWQASIGGDGKYIGLGANPFDAFVALYSSLHPNGGPSELTDWNPQNFSDGYHTMGELYQHRHVLFAMVAKLANWGTGDRKLKGWKSWKHSDGTMLDGWFIAGLELPQGQISYHLPAEWWPLIQLPHHDFAPQWDGYDANDCLDRMREWILQPSGHG